MKKRVFHHKWVIGSLGYIFLSCYCTMVVAESSSPTSIDPNYMPAAGAKITFGEVSVGIPISYHYAHLGIFFSGDDPHTIWDGANPQNSPVLCGTPSFLGAIEGHFIVPQAPDPNTCDPNLIAVVSWFSLDAGVFNGLGTTCLQWFDANGVKLGEIVNTKTGIETFRVEGLNIARWRIEMTASDIQGFAIDNVDFELAPHIAFTKSDDVAAGDCRNIHEDITYTICWHNKSDRTLYDAVIIDYLPEEVGYPQGLPSIEFGDPNDPGQPLFILIPPDPGYDAGSHSYVWPIGNIGPSEYGCVPLNVVVNDKAAPGGLLKNTAELWATIHDANGLNPEFKIIARAIKHTPVCCWETELIIYVDASAPDGGNGRSWRTAYTDLQNAFARCRAARCGRIYTIYVAEGTYSPGTDAADTFEIPDGVWLYGGFPKGGGAFERRNPNLYKTILSGRINQTIRNDTVVKMGHNTLLDGVFVRDASHYGIFGAGVDFEVNGCNISSNSGYGIFGQNGNIFIKWCQILSNNWDGIRHIGNGKSFTAENCQIRDNRQYGLYLENSAPTIRNSIISKNGEETSGYYGILILEPSDIPIFFNNTVVYNFYQAIGYYSSNPNHPNLPQIQNTIIWHNNNGGDQLLGITADATAWYSCIQDCNDVNYNINCEPGFAYPLDLDNIPDPNRMHLAWDSPCRDAGNPAHTTEDVGVYDMDGEERLYGGRVDIGADEVVACDGVLSEDDVYNAIDWDANGLVNLYEFNFFSSAWMAHDPNDPAVNDPNYPDYDYLTNPASPGYIKPSQFEAWNPAVNFAAGGDSQYVIDMADLLAFLDSPWGWVACWRTDIWLMRQEMAMSFPNMTVPNETFAAQSVTENAKLMDNKTGTLAQQIVELHRTIQKLEALWLEDEHLQQQVNPYKWQRFLDEVYNRVQERVQTEILNSREQ